MDEALIALRVLGIYLIVALLSGWIAYIGNQVGRKIGRRKMSVLGLRPKHTSIVITVLTGSLIAIVTLSLAAFLSESVRGLLTGTKQLEARAEYLKAEVLKLEEQLKHARIVWGVNEPILMATLNPMQGTESLRVQISSAIGQANDLSILRNNEIASQKGEGPLSPETQLVVSDDKQVEELLNVLATRDKVCGVRVLAEKNCLYKDKVPVKLELFDVSLVFREGEEVASRLVQPKGSQILEWYAFLEQMKVNALRRGMIQINDSLGGEIDSSEVLRLVKKIESLKKPGRLVAIARRDLYQPNRLDVKIEVRADASDAGGGGGAPTGGSAADSGHSSR